MPHPKGRRAEVDARSRPRTPGNPHRSCRAVGQTHAEPQRQARPRAELQLIPLGIATRSPVGTKNTAPGLEQQAHPARLGGRFARRSAPAAPALAYSGKATAGSAQSSRRMQCLLPPPGPPFRLGAHARAASLGQGLRDAQRELSPPSRPCSSGATARPRRSDEGHAFSEPPMMPVSGETSLATIQSQPLRSRLAMAWPRRFRSPPRSPQQGQGRPRPSAPPCEDVGVFGK
jgi:hypothetical protein